MPIAGLDIHKRVVEAVILGDNGQITSRHRFPMTREHLEGFARKHLSPAHRVALEATTNTWPAVAVLQPHVAEVVVSNPLRTRAIAEAKVKTDRVDALVLAELLRADYLPSVWTPDVPTQQMRRLSTRRASLVGDSTRIKNRIHAVLDQRMIAAPEGDLFGKAGRRWLERLPLDAPGRAALDSELRLLVQVESELDSLSREMAAQAWDDPRIKLLITLPGVDVAVAHALIAALGDPARFPDPDRAAAYLGLVPSTRQSADHCYHGPITKQGRGHARWLLVQAAQHLGNHPGPLGVFFRRLARRKNRNVAVVATARKLVTIAWHMLKNNEPYRYALPRPTDEKLSRLRRAAGRRRKTGPARGSAPAARNGQRTRAVPSLDRVYAREAMPPLAPPAAGETAMLQRAGLRDFAGSLRQDHRVPRGTGRKKA